MPTCPSCMESYGAETSTCPVDGSELVPDETYTHVDKDLAPGEVVGEYRIEGKIGVGGFGAVYRAVHPVIGKEAAIKVLGREFSSSPHMVSRFVAEARAVNQIRNKNIIDIFAFGQLPDGRQYYVMELLDGAPFDAYLADHERLTIGQALPILRGLVRALDAAHAKGILHRDLKPENVYLVFDEDGGVLPKLLDFGLAKLLGEKSGTHHTKTGTPMGTPYYMSPEQCRGLAMDRRTDVYAFGAMVFEILVGEVPYSGQSALDIILKHMSEPPPSASERCSSVPPELDAPIKCMLAKDPDERPATMTDALELLVQAAQAAGVLSDAALPVLPLLSSGRRFETRPTELDRRAALKLVGGQTFLSTESDVPETPSGKGRLVVAALGSMVVAAIAVVAFMTATHVSPTATATATASPIVQTATIVVPPPAATTAALHREVEVRIDGAPEGALVALDGEELGPAPGPFKVAAGSPAKLTVSAKGYKAREVPISLTADVLVPITLEKIVQTAAKLPAASATVLKANTTIHSDLEGFDTKK